MEKLLSLTDIQKLGYKREGSRSFIKGKNERMVLCSHCGSWYSSRGKRLSGSGDLIVQCFWCDGHQTITVKGVKS